MAQTASHPYAAGCGEEAPGIVLLVVHGQRGATLRRLPALRLRFASGLAGLRYACPRRPQPALVQWFWWFGGLVVQMAEVVLVVLAVEVVVAAVVVIRWSC